MDIIFGILGFIIGIVLFFFLLDRFTMIFSGIGGIIGLFVFCWVIGIILVQIAWWIAIIIGGIALIFYLISKFTGSTSTEEDKQTENQESADTTTTENQ